MSVAPLTPQKAGRATETLFACLPPDMTSVLVTVSPMKLTPKGYNTNLHEREVLLPPDVLGVHADKVVGVHDRVDEAVQDDRQVNVAIVAGVHVQPVELIKNRKRGTDSHSVTRASQHHAKQKHTRNMHLRANPIGKEAPLLLEGLSTRNQRRTIKVPPFLLTYNERLPMPQFRLTRKMVQWW